MYRRPYIEHDASIEDEEIGPETAEAIESVGGAAEQFFGKEVYIDPAVQGRIGSLSIRAFYEQDGEQQSKNLRGEDLLQGMPLGEYKEFLDGIGGPENIVDIKSMETRHSGSKYAVMDGSWNFDHEERLLSVMFSTKEEVRPDMDGRPDRYIVMNRSLEPSETEEYEAVADTWANKFRRALGYEPATEKKTKVISQSPCYTVAVRGEVFRGNDRSEVVTDFHEELPDRWELVSNT